MEILIQAHARQVAEQKKYLIGEAYFIFVALDDPGHPVGVAVVLPDSEKKLNDTTKHSKEEREKQSE